MRPVDSDAAQVGDGLGMPVIWDALASKLGNDSDIVALAVGSSNRVTKY